MAQQLCGDILVGSRGDLSWSLAEGGMGVLPPREVIYETSLIWLFLEHGIRISLLFSQVRDRLRKKGLFAPKLGQNEYLAKISRYSKTHIYISETTLICEQKKWRIHGLF